MTTYRTILNRVLRTLGEEEIGAAVSDLATNEYPALVGQFLNIIKTEVEDATNWRVLQEFDTASLLANTDSIALTNATSKSRVVRLSQAEVAAGARASCYDVTDANDPDTIHEMDLVEVKMRLQVDPTLRASDSPSHFAVEQSATGLNLRVWPKPSGARSIIVLLATPEARLEADDLDVVISVDETVLELGTLWMALEERGEELGIEGVFNEQRYRVALDSAVSRDEAESGDSTELTVA